MRIDIHSHFLHLDFIKHLEGRDSLPSSYLQGGTYAIDCAEAMTMMAGPRIVEMDVKVREQETMGIGLSVLSHGMPGPEMLPADEADDWASRINDHLAGIIEAYPGRFLGWGSLGFGDVERTMAEADRCINELGFKGFQLFSNIGGRLVDSPELVRVYKHVAGLGVPLNMHPTVPLNRIGMSSHGLIAGLGYMYDTSLALMRIINSGLFDQVPDLKLIMPHCGGVVPYLTGRLGRRPLEGATGRVEDYLRMVYYDTVTYHFETLDYLFGYFGAERILYGTDLPFADVVPSADSFVEQLDCTDAERELIYHGNAETLLGI